MEETHISIDEQSTDTKKTFFQKIAFLLLDKERKTEVAQEIIEDGDFGKLYRLQIILSGIICTLGLLINSIPVVIGAMLIAPILIPIKIIAFATTTGNRHLYKKGLKVSFLSILISIAIAGIITQITPISTLTSEIYARISPTMVDLFIALASGVIAFLSLGFKKLREQIAGVAMATALIPPLCVTGIGISFLNIEIAKGSFLLFLTNFFAIIFVGIIIFYAFGFFPTNRKGKKRSIESIIITIITIIVISIPLTNSMKSIADDINTKQKIEKVTDEFFGNINKKIEIEKISYQIQDNETLRINATIDVPSTTPITEKQKNDLSKILALSTQKSVNLDLNIVNISSALIEKKEEISNDEKVQQSIVEYIKAYTGMTIIESKIAYNPTPLVYLNIFGEHENIKEKIENDIEIISKEILGTGTNILVLWQQKNDKEEQQQQIAHYQEIKKFIQENLQSNIYINTFDIEKKTIYTGESIIITMEIQSALDNQTVQNQLQKIKDKLKETYQESYVFKVNFITISEIAIK